MLLARAIHSLLSEVERRPLGWALCGGVNCDGGGMMVGWWWDCGGMVVGWWWDGGGMVVGCRWWWDGGVTLSN